MRRHLILPVLVLCAPAPLRLSAQERLTVGQIAQGTITSLDPTTSEGQHYDDWRVQLRARHRYRVVMRSRSFDAFVALGRTSAGNFVMTSSDDDGGGGTDASAMIVPPTDGDYVVRARPLSNESTGGYSIAVTDEGEVQPLRAQLITPAQAVSGTLNSTDATTDEGKPVDYYRFAAKGGHRYAVTLLAQGFDAYLESGSGANGVFQKERSNDDGGGGTNARLSWVTRESGEVWILARSFNDDLGNYTLLLEDLGEAPLPGPAVMIASGQGMDGTLDETDEEGEEGRYDAYTIEGRAGQVVVIRMDSEAFDPVVSIGRDQDGAWHELDKDDDGGLGTNAHLEYRFPESGRYTIRARAIGRDGKGAYTIRVE